MNEVKKKQSKEPYVFILQIDQCILGDLTYNRYEYDMYRTLNNINREKNIKYDTKIDLLRPGVLDFIEFIKKKYKNKIEIYIYSNHDHYWVNDIIGPYIQKQFKVNKPYFTNADKINNSFPLETIYNNVIYPMLVKKYKQSSPNINNVVFINNEILLTHKDRQITVPLYEKLQYINIYDKMINLFGKDAFDNEQILATYNRLSDKLSRLYLINDINEKDEVFRKLITLYNMRSVEVTNAKDDTYFSTLITKMKELPDLSDLSKLTNLEKKLKVL
jgi:hypothetical protein